VLIDPVGSIALHQKVLPLDHTLTEYGTGHPSGPDRYGVTGVTVGSSAVSSWEPVTDFFAPAQFEEMTDAEKLSRPSFELMHAGIRFASEALTEGAGVGTTVTYETIIIDSPWESRLAGLYILPLAHQFAFMGRSASAQAPLQTSGFQRFAPDPRAPVQVILAEERFVIASTLDLSVRQDIVLPGTKGATSQALKSYLAAHPAERGQLQVVPVHEVEVGL